MPINPRQFVNQMKQRRTAVKNLHSEAGWAGYHTGFGVNQDRRGDVFGNNNGPFSAPNGAQRLEAATSRAKAAGVSSRKINKITNKANKIGFNEGQRDLPKFNPFK